MQAEHQCIIHDGMPINQVCIHHNCEQIKLLCDKCLQQHSQEHMKIKFDIFMEHHLTFTKIYEQNYNKIKNTFQKLREAFNICIKRAQERTINEFGKVPPQFFGLKFSDLEVQQLYGVSESYLNNKIFLAMIECSNPNKIKQIIKEKEQQIQMQIQNLQSQIIISINQFAGKIKPFGDYFNPSKLNNLIPNAQEAAFKFCNTYKSDLLCTSTNKMKLQRFGGRKNGLSVYGIVNQPLNMGNKLRQITFKITQQKNLYMYFGVCDRQSFNLLNYEGRLYEKGNKMYAIRQNSLPKRFAVTLHNSLDFYSNRQVVLWDLELGDQLRLNLEPSRKGENKNSNFNLIFTKNNSYKFILPLDNQTKDFYPFVGMKFDNDEIVIVDKEQSYKLDNFNEQFQKSVVRVRKEQLVEKKKKNWLGF